MNYVLKQVYKCGRVIGAMVIVVGLYLVIWGKAKDERETRSVQIEVIDQELGPLPNPSPNSPQPILGASLV